MYCVKCKTTRPGYTGEIHKCKTRARVTAKCKTCGCPMSQFISSKLITGKGFDFVKKINDLFPDVEFHLYNVKMENNKPKLIKNAFLGPGTAVHNRVNNYNELLTKDIDYITPDTIDYITKPISSVDRLASVHDIQYGIADTKKDKKEGLKLKHKADGQMINEALKIVKDKNESMQIRAQAGFVGAVLKSKKSLGLGIKKK